MNDQLPESAYAVFYAACVLLGVFIALVFSAGFLLARLL